jgi:cobalamin-dependent methionine synthase I
MIGQFEIRTQRLSQKVITSDCSGKIDAVVNSFGTVKSEIYDIGKTIVAAVFAGSDFEIVDQD